MPKTHRDEPLRTRTKRAIVGLLDSTKPGRRVHNALRAGRRDPDLLTAPTTRRSSAHTARDVTSIDPTKFALTFYSQFGEDAVIRGFFRRREEDRIRSTTGAEASDNPIGSGFYVDVGCYHPSRFSNTMHFYDAGWRGLNIDPSVGTKELFDRARPGDITLEVAVSEHDGVATLFTSGYGGRSVFNTIDQSQARAYHEAGRVAQQVQIDVQTLRLDTILERHVPVGQEISFLDVDVEGHDLQVLRSNDWTRFRPILVVVESHLAAIEEVLTDPTYVFMLDQGYVLQSWVRPNMLFRRDTA